MSVRLSNERHGDLAAVLKVREVVCSRQGIPLLKFQSARLRTASTKQFDVKTDGPHEQVHVSQASTSHLRRQSLADSSMVSMTRSFTPMTSLCCCPGLAPTPMAAKNCQMYMSSVSLMEPGNR